MHRYATLLSAITLLFTAPVVAQERALLRDFSDERCQGHLTNARRLDASGAVPEALMVFEEGTNECERHAPLLADYGWVLVQSGEPAQGVRILERAYNAATAAQQRAAILHSVGVAQEHLGAQRSAMNAYLGSLQLRSSAATSARARALSHRHHRAHPDAPPLGSEGRIQVVPSRGAWQELAPCDFHAAADAARYMGESPTCESARRWREGEVTFERVRVGDSVEAFDELWAQRASQWIRLRTDDVWQGVFGGEFTNLDYENVRTVRRGEDTWLYVDAQFMTVDYDYSEAYREDHFVHWACRVGDDSECVEINRGDEFFAGPGRCYHWGECSADDTLVQADERALPVDGGGTLVQSAELDERFLHSGVWLDLSLR